MIVWVHSITAQGADTQPVTTVLAWLQLGSQIVVTIHACFADYIFHTVTTHWSYMHGSTTGSPSPFPGFRTDGIFYIKNKTIQKHSYLSDELPTVQNKAHTDIIYKNMGHCTMIITMQWLQYKWFMIYSDRVTQSCGVGHWYRWGILQNKIRGWKVQNRSSEKWLIERVTESEGTCWQICVYIAVPNYTDGYHVQQGTERGELKLIMKY